MNTQPAGPTRDLRWWDIPGWVYGWRRQLLGAALGGLLCGLATMLWWSIFRYVEGTVVALVLTVLTLFGGVAAGLLVALVVGHSGAASRSRPSRRLTPAQSQRRPSKLAGGLWFGLAAGLSSGLLFGLWVVLQNWQEGVYDGSELSTGVPVGAVAGIVFGLIVGRSGRDPQVMVLRRPTAQDLRRGRRRIVTGGLPAGLGVGLLFMVMFWGSSPVWILFDLAVALVFWIMFGFMFWLVGDLWNHPLAAAPDVTPRSVYRKDVQTRLTSAFVFGVMGGLPVGLVLSLILSVVDMLEVLEMGEAGEVGDFHLMETLLLGLIAGLVLGLVLGLIGGLRDGASPLLLCTEVVFMLRGRPVRVIRLLESARERQVLRQAGAVYQFRHANLQDRLADRYRQEHLSADM